MNPIQTIPLMDIALKQANALRDSEQIREFCLEKYGKQPQIVIGHNVKNKLGKDDCPAILIPRMGKTEGENSSEHSYYILFGWMIENGEQEEIDGISVLKGIEESDALGQMIYETICHLNPSCPVTESNYEIEAVDYFPIIIGEMQLNINVPRVLGAKIEY